MTMLLKYVKYRQLGEYIADEISSMVGLCQDSG